MRARSVFLPVFFLLGIIFICANNASGQVRQEREERSLQKASSRHSRRPYKVSSSLGLNFGYETNPRLSSERKGDWFEELIYAVKFTRRLSNTMRLNFDYSFDIVNYHEFTDITNTLNYFNVGIDKKLPFCYVGTGYNAGIVAYPKNDSDFVYHKGYVYLGKKISRRTYHKLQFEYGTKDYFSANVLGDSLGSYQSQERLDRRLGAEYNVIVKLTPETVVRLKSKFSRNDSNARFVDFYDYNTYQQSLDIDYRLFSDVTIFSDLSYRRKEYDSRTITNGTDEQRDNLYTARFGVRKQLNRNNAVSLEYLYRENSSNDSLEEYSESVVTCGWRYSF